VIPAVTGPDRIVRPGVEGLRYLARLAVTAGLPPNLPAPAGAAADRTAGPPSAPRAA
jgi:hypothetical protein